MGGSGSVSTLTIDSSSPFSYTGAIGGAGANENNLALTKTGSGTQTLSGALSYTGPTTVTGGTLKLTNVSGDFASNINNSATVELYSASGGNWYLGSGKTLSGGGTYVKTGPGRVALPNVVVTASGQILVEEGTLSNEYNSCDWSGSSVSLDVSLGAIFDMRADSVKVNVLTGSGTIRNSYGAGGGATDTLTVSSGNFSGSIGGNGDGQSGENRGKTALAKVGAGTLILSGASTYTGPTTVSGGTLQVDGSIASTADLTVEDGWLLGTGSIAGRVVVGPDGTVSAGHSPGHIQYGGYDQNGGTMVVDITGPTQGPDPGDPGYDWIEVTGSGTATLFGTIDIRLDGYVPYSGETFDVLTATTVTVDGPLELLEDPGLLAPAQYWDYRIASLGTAGQALELFVGVPEPGTLALAVLGALSLLAFWRRRRRA